MTITIKRSATESYYVAENDNIRIQSLKQYEACEKDAENNKWIVTILTDAYSDYTARYKTKKACVEYITRIFDEIKDM
ncbi:MAG: hypothetical protein ACRDCE_14735 [Cetobacterium sp.]|uniref:hypothetical protein n=1 Tax=Cetobacterium sp. TaxID=2071632 RepID=UPI003EE633DC